MDFISLNIKYLVGREKVSNDEFGKRFGLNRGAVLSYIQGKAIPKLQTLQNISAVSGFSIDDLVNTDISNTENKSVNNSKNINQRGQINSYKSKFTGGSNVSRGNDNSELIELRIKNQILEEELARLRKREEELIEKMLNSK